MKLVRKVIPVLLAIAMAATMTFVGVTPASGQPPEVWVDDDWAGSSPGDVVDGHTFGTDAFAKIRDGIDAVTSPGKVHVAAGTYYENITLNDGVEVLGAGADVTTIDGGGAGSVVTADGVGPETMVDGFTITGGSSDYGGGIDMRDSSATIRNNILQSNSASELGGGTFVHGGPVTITNNTFQGNTAGVGGGGIFMDESSPNIINNTFDGNSADGNVGGGIFMENSSPTVSNNTFQDNTTWGFGGGISMWHSSPSMTNNSF